MAGSPPYGTLALGAVTLVGSAFLGKVLVDAVEGDSHPDDDTAFSESVKLVASLVGISVTLLQLPAAWNEAQKLIRGAVDPAPSPGSPIVPG